MKVLREIRDYKDGVGNVNYYLCWECDKCDNRGSFSIDKDVKEIPKDRRKCCEDKKQSD